MIEADPLHVATAQVGVDVGGTFTDAALVHESRLFTAKVPTTSDDQSRGVIAAVDMALSRAGFGAGAVARFAHGMTVGTNALLEGTGARTALVATEGFGDVLELRRQNRAHLYRLDVGHPAPLVDRNDVIEVPERCGPDDVITPLTDEMIDNVVAQVADRDVPAVAICLLFSYAHPSHERRLAAALRSALPGVHVSASCDVLAEIREFERASTTVIDATLGPLLGDYLRGLATRARAAGLPKPEIMQSNGGVTELAYAAEHAAVTVLSGPAAGAIGAAQVASDVGAPVALTFDMGGTSCDVALVVDGQPGRAAAATINGHPIHLPMLDVETVSAGGGSIAWADGGGALRVGPRSAGARPGPAAYGHGGTRPTVTDANVVLGRLATTQALGGEIRLDPVAAHMAVATLADELGIEVEVCARGILSVSVEEMARVVRRASVERGVDPRGACIVAFGGAGPLHACAVAEAVGVTRVVAPAAAGVLAALGVIVAPERRDWSRSILTNLGSDTQITAVCAALTARAHEELPGARTLVSVDCRYVGQSHSLNVAWQPDDGINALIGAFHEVHQRRFGGSRPEHDVQAVTVRLAAEHSSRAPAQPAGEVVETMRGPCAIAMDGATCWVAPGWSAAVHESGLIDMHRDEVPSSTR